MFTLFNHSETGQKICLLGNRMNELFKWLNHG